MADSYISLIVPRQSRVIFQPESALPSTNSESELSFGSQSGIKIVGWTEALPSAPRTQPVDKFFPNRPKATMTAKDLESAPLTPGLKLSAAIILRRQTIKVTDEAIALHFLICGTLSGQNTTALPSQLTPASLTSLSASPSGGSDADQPTNRCSTLSHGWPRHAKRSCNSLPVDYFDSPNLTLAINPGSTCGFTGTGKSEIGGTRPCELADAAGK